MNDASVEIGGTPEGRSAVGAALCTPDAQRIGLCAVLIAPGITPTAGAAVALHFKSQAQWLSSPGGMPALSDVNGDGKADLVLFGLAPDYRGIYVALSTGAGFAPPKLWGHSNCGQTGGAQICLMADVNEDKKGDVVGFAWGDGKSDGSAKRGPSTATDSTA